MTDALDARIAALGPIQADPAKALQPATRGELVLLVSMLAQAVTEQRAAIEALTAGRKPQAAAHLRAAQEAVVSATERIHELVGYPKG